MEVDWVHQRATKPMLLQSASVYLVPFLLVGVGYFGIRNLRLVAAIVTVVGCAISLRVFENGWIRPHLLYLSLALHTLVSLFPERDDILLEIQCVLLLGAAIMALYYKYDVWPYPLTPSEVVTLSIATLVVTR